MNKKIIGISICIAMLVMSLGGCQQKKEDVKIAVSLGTGAASRWETEKMYMEEHAKSLGVNIEVRLNKTDTPKTQVEDCKEMIDSGADVLILTTRNVEYAEEILQYAKENKVPVISYSRVLQGKQVELFVGYDSARMGQKMGQYLSEKVLEGDYIILRGDDGDNNATLLYEGAMHYIEPLKEDIHILLNAEVPGWSPEEAEKMVYEAVTNNGNKVDAILAPNDKIAGACYDAIQRAGVEETVVITGMDAELEAVQRIVQGTQDMTIFMDLKLLANTAVEEAVHLAQGEKVNVNSEFDNKSDQPIPANLITGEMVTKENIERILIERGYYTKEEVYGE